MTDEAMEANLKPSIDIIKQGEDFYTKVSLSKLKEELIRRRDGLVKISSDAKRQLKQVLFDIEHIDSLV